MKVISIPIILYYSNDVNNDRPLAFVPMLFVNLLTLEPLLYSKIYKSCMVLSNKFIAGIEPRPVLWHNGKLYRDKSGMSIRDLANYFGGDFRIAFLFPEHTVPDDIIKIVAKYRIESHQVKITKS